MHTQITHTHTTHTHTHTHTLSLLTEISVDSLLFSEGEFPILRPPPTATLSVIWIVGGGGGWGEKLPYSSNLRFIRTVNSA